MTGSGSPSPETALSSARLQWMDFLRGLCILLVIFVHATGATEDWGLVRPFQGFVIFNDFLDPFRMPLLMFLSGMLLHKSLNKPLGTYIRGKFHLIFWPFLIWSLAIYAAENRLTLEYILKTPISAPSVLWYLWFLCAFYLIALGLTRFSVPLLPVIALSVIASEFLPSLLRMDRFAALFAFFLLGHVVASRGLAARIAMPVAMIALAAALVGGAISVAGLRIKYDPVYVWVPLGLVVFALWAARFYKPHRAFAPIEWIGRNSIVFYVAHFPIIVILARILAGTWPGPALTLLLFLAAIILGALLQMLRARFTVFAGLFDFRQVLKLVGRDPRPARQG